MKSFERTFIIEIQPQQCVILLILRDNFLNRMTPNIYKGSKTDFSYLVGMSLQRRMPWETLASLLKDLAPTLEETREVISILLKELEFLQSSLQKKEKELEIFEQQKVEDDSQDKNNFLEAVHEENQQESTLSETKTIDDEIEVLEDVKESIDGKKYLDVNKAPKSYETYEHNSDDDDGSLEEIDNEWYTFVKNTKTFVPETEASVPEKEFSPETELSEIGKHLTEENENDEDKSVKEIDNEFYTFVANDKKSDSETDVTVESEQVIDEESKRKPFQCSFCQKAFQNSGNLKSHERIHTGEVPFGCKTCLKRFKTKFELKSHERIHTVEVPFECKACKKRFKQRGHLKKHQRIHTGEKPYKCNVCNKKFNSSSHLKSHKRIHTT